MTAITKEAGGTSGLLIMVDFRGGNNTFAPAPDRHVRILNATIGSA